MDCTKVRRDECAPRVGGQRGGAGPGRAVPPREHGPERERDERDGAPEHARGRGAAHEGRLQDLKATVLRQGRAGEELNLLHNQRWAWCSLLLPGGVCEHSSPSSPQNLRRRPRGEA